MRLTISTSRNEAHRAVAPFAGATDNADETLIKRDWLRQIDQHCLPLAWLKVDRLERAGAVPPDVEDLAAVETDLNSGMLGQKRPGAEWRDQIGR